MIFPHGTSQIMMNCMGVAEETMVSKVVDQLMM